MSQTDSATHCKGTLQYVILTESGKSSASIVQSNKQWTSSKADCEYPIDRNKKERRI